MLREKHFCSFLSSKICCSFKNLSINYFTFAALHPEDKILDEQQIFGLTYKEKEMLFLALWDNLLNIFFAVCSSLVLKRVLTHKDVKG